MQSVSAAEAEARIDDLLDAVERGETIMITRDGVPVAELRPPGAGTPTNANDADFESREYRHERQLK